MARDNQMSVRVSTDKKMKIKERAASLNRSVSEHLLICYDLEESIAKADSIVIPKREQVESDGVPANQTS
jgi:hypothetical protein